MRKSEWLFFPDLTWGGIEMNGWLWPKLKNQDTNLIQNVHIVWLEAGLSAYSMYTIFKLIHFAKTPSLILKKKSKKQLVAQLKFIYWRL